MAGEGLIDSLLRDPRGKEMLEQQIQDDFKDGYIEGHRKFAFLEGRKQAVEDIVESKKPGFFKRGVQNALKTPQRMNLKANNTFADKRQILINKINSTTRKFEKFSDKDLKFRV